MAAALTAVRFIDPEMCRQTARERFSAARMTRRYIDLYVKQASRPVLPEQTREPGALHLKRL